MKNNSDIRTSLIAATKTLKKAGVETPWLDARVLLSHVLKKDAAWLFAHPETELTPAAARRFALLVSRRAERESVACLTGHKEFYGLDFFVNRHTLIPRPETETLIETVLQEMHLRCNRLPGRISDAIIVDVGTGSGAIAITLAKHLPKATIYATDISAAALRVARKNAQRHKVRVHFKHGNLLTPVKIQVLKSKCQILIVANLPYLTTTQWHVAAPEIKKYEPRHALAAGPDGLRFYKILMKQIEMCILRVVGSSAGATGSVVAPPPSHFRKLVCGASSPVISRSPPPLAARRMHILLEIDPRQTKPLTALVREKFPDATVEIKKDLAGRNRVLVAIV